MLKNPEKAQLWSAWICRIFANTSKNMSKKAIEREIKGRIIEGSRRTGKEFEEILNYEPKFIWIENGERNTFIDDNRIVLCMEHNKTRTQNIIHAIVDYVDNGLIPNYVKELLDEEYCIAQKLVLAKKIIASTYKVGLRYFNENFYYIEEATEKFREYLSKLTKIDDDGMFTLILVKQLIKVANEINVIGSIPSLGCFFDGEQIFNYHTTTTTETP